jgi:hypothetical protein
LQEAKLLVAFAGFSISVLLVGDRRPEARAVARPRALS